MLEVMLASWNADERAFQVGDRLIPFILYDVALILGLPVRGELIDCNQSHPGGSLVETLLNTHLKTVSSEWTKLVTLLTKSSIKVPDRVRLYMALILSYFLFPTTSQKVTTNLLPLLDDRANLGRYAWGKAVYEFLVSDLNCTAASKKAQKTRGNLHITRLHCLASGVVRACSDAMGATGIRGTRNHGDLARNPCSKLRGLNGKALARHVKRLEDELNCVKGLVATMIKSSPTIQQNQTPPSQNLEQNQPPIQSQLPIQTPIVDLPSSLSKAVKRGKPAKKKPRVDSNEVAISTNTYEITGRDVSSLLGDQAQKKVLGQRSKRPKKGKQPIEDDQPGPESVFRSSWVRAMPRECNRRKALEQLYVEKLGHRDVETWLLEYKNDIPNQDHYA
uniref:Aminotransferase-like plant mobile domain-containing protein n=1 Tax=Fagus sylvatica TaxID=28930 RepID=A0A2N9HV88_FAGSY